MLPRFRRGTDRERISGYRQGSYVSHERESSERNKSPRLWGDSRGVFLISSDSTIGYKATNNEKNDFHE